MNTQSVNGGDRETASYLPINSINEHQTVDGKTVNMIFDAWGRQLGVPTFNYPRPPYEEDLRPSDDVKYYRFDPDDEHKVVVYRMTGYTKVLPSGGNGGGGGGGSSSVVPLQSHIIDSTSTSAYIPVLSGGMIYEYTQPLTVLSIGEIQSSIQETDILFTAGATVSPPASIKVKYPTGQLYDGEGMPHGNTYLEFEMVSSGNGYASCPASNTQPLINFTWEDWDDETPDNNYYSELVGGSFTFETVNGKQIISAVNVSQYSSNTTFKWDEGTADYIESTDEHTNVLNNWIASSTDNMQTWVINNNATLTVGWMDDMAGDGVIYDSPATIEADQIITPCDVILPSGTLLVNSSSVSVESGGKYEMNVKYGAIVTGEWKVKQ